MRFIGLACLVFLLGACAGSYPPATAVVTAPTIAVGDQLHVIVFAETNLSGIYAVDQRGQITMPLAGRIALAGQTLSAASHTIEQALRDYVRQPHIAVSFDKQADLYVLGEVQKPGNYASQPGLTVVQAIAKAGGFTYRAAKGDLVLQHHGQSQKFRATETTPVVPGDTITVGERFF